MILIHVRYDARGCIFSLDVEGHAGDGQKGESIVCAGVSTLVRTAARLLEKEAGIVFSGSAAFAGMLNFKVSAYPSEKTGRLQGITDFLCLGLLDLSRDFPEDLDITIELLKE